MARSAEERALFKAVRKFFREDGFQQASYEKIVRKAKFAQALTSSLGDLTGVHGSKLNPTESKVINTNEYRQAFKAVEVAIKNCQSADSKIILKERYLNHETISTTMFKLGISGNQSFSNREAVALLEFAELIEWAKQHLKISDKIIPNFKAEAQEEIKREGGD